MALIDLTQPAKHNGGKVTLFHVILLNCFLALASIISMNGGTLNEETSRRLIFHLSDKPFLNKMFDSRVLDDGFYRARELSYFFDFFDFKFIEFSIENGFPHFLSLTHYLLSIVTGCLLAMFFVKKLNLRPLAGMGILALFWTSPNVFFGSINRTGKIWVAFLETILIYFFHTVAFDAGERTVSRISAKRWIMYFIIISAMSLLDEQGFFLAFALLVVLSIWIFFVRDKNIFIMLSIVAASLIMNGLCKYMIIPRLTCILNGYWPVIFFWELPMKYYVQNLGTCLAGGFSLYIDTFRFLTGHPSRIVGSGLFIIFISIPLFYLFSVKALPVHDRKISALIYIELLITNLLLIFMNSLMVLRIPSINAHVFFWLPTIVILVITLAILTNILYKLRIPRWIISLAICIAITGNIINNVPVETIVSKVFSKNSMPYDSALLNALKNIESVKNVHDPLIKNDPVFQFFKSKKEWHASKNFKIAEFAGNKRLCQRPNDADAYNEKGIFYANVGEYQSAIEDFNKAIRLTPNHVHALNNRGLAYAKLGKYQLAIEDINNVIRMEPDFTNAYINRGIVYFTQGNKESGCRDAQKACAMGNCMLLEMAKRNKYCP